MNRISSRHFIKISSKHKDEKNIILNMREKAKNDSIVKEKFKEYGVPISDIDKVHISFENLDVSAKTKNCKIYINRMLLEKNEDPTSYLVHELTHYLQQKTGNTLGSQDAEYMDKKTEMEAFNAQVDFKKREDGEKEAEKYVDDLLDYHNINGNKRKEKKKELLQS